MKIFIEVDLDNQAFQYNPNELQEIVAKQIPHNLEPDQVGTLKDSNGNRVGLWEVVE